MGRMAGKVAIVTGAARGIGAASARLLAREAAAVLVTDLAAEAVEAVAAEIRAGGGDAIGLRQDVSDEAGWIEVVGHAVSRWGRLDVLVNNAAAFGRQAPLWELSLADWRQVQAVNVEGVFLGLKHALPRIAEHGGGSVINVSSVLGKVATPQIAPYCTSKAAVAELSKAAALECAQAKWPVRVNSLHPGYVMKPEYDDAGPDYLRSIRALHPIGRIGEPEEIAEVILFLASEASSFMTGTEVFADGGYTAR